MISAGSVAEAINGIYLSTSFGTNVAVSCSYADETSTNAVEYQVSTMTNGYEIDQITQWADLELAFFADDTFGEEVTDAELAIGTAVYMQVRWGQSFGETFPVEFYISDCIVSDADNHEYKVIEAGCGEAVVDATLLSNGEYSQSQNPIQYRYNSFSFTEEETVAQQTVRCNIKFCLQADIDSGDCGYTCA